MYGGRVQYAIARAVYGQIRYAQGKPGGVPADIIGLGRHLSEIEGFYRALILKPSLQRTETIIIELNRAPMNEKAFKRQVDHLIHRWAQETIPAQANIIFDTASQSTIEKLDIRQVIEAAEKQGMNAESSSHSIAATRNKLTSAAAEPPGPAHFSPLPKPILSVPPSEPGRPVNLARTDVSNGEFEGLQAEHLKILIEALEVMSELESGHLEILTDLARKGRIPSALRLKQEDRIRCILKADELIRKAKMILTGEGVGAMTALDYIQSSEATMRAQAIHALRHQIQRGGLTLDASLRITNQAGAAREPEFDALIDIEKDLQDSARRRAGLLRPTRYTRSDVLRALEHMHSPENG